MNRLIIRRLVFYVAGAVVIMAVCMSGSLRVIGDVDYSVWMAIMELPKNFLQLSSIENAFNAGMSVRLGMLMPLIASVPAAVETMDDIQSGFCTYIEVRKGRRRYAYSKFFSCVLHTGVIVLSGIGLYIVVICIVFPVNPDYSGYVSADFNGTTVVELFTIILMRVIYIYLYTVVISLTATLLVFLYQNLYFDFSIIFFMSYICRVYFVENKVICILAIIAIVFLFYGIIWKRKSEKT